MFWFVAPDAVEQRTTWFVTPGAVAWLRKDLPTMSIALRNKQVFTLIVLALLTLLALTFILLTAVAHIDVWHSFISLVPSAMFPHS